MNFIKLAISHFAATGALFSVCKALYIGNYLVVVKRFLTMDAQTIIGKSLLAKGEVDRLFQDILKNYGHKLRREVEICVFNKSNCDDIYQEGLIDLYNALPRFRGECHINTYANACFSNTIKNYIRSRKSLQRRTEIDVELGKFVENNESNLANGQLIAKAAPNPEELYALKEIAKPLIPELERAISLLAKEGPQYAEVYKVMIDFFREFDRDITIKELADLLGIPEATVKTRQFRARKMLRELIDEDAWYW